MSIPPTTEDALHEERGTILDIYEANSTSFDNNPMTALCRPDMLNHANICLPGISRITDLPTQRRLRGHLSITGGNLSIKQDHLDRS
jgi:hypothetical protein